MHPQLQRTVRVPVLEAASEVSKPRIRREALGHLRLLAEVPHAHLLNAQGVSL